ncbi:hypothetical protein OIU78_009620 [Salix suchowensis]|nr:hypothetical protein OIU78_009620 [Salix suchowensis]
MYVHLNQNQLSGSIPLVRGKLSKLYELRLSRNSFSGEIPSELGQPQNLQSILDLSYDNLSGHIPPSIGTLSKLEALDLSHNWLVGAVPPEKSVARAVLASLISRSMISKANWASNSHTGHLKHLKETCSSVEALLSLDRCSILKRSSSRHARDQLLHLFKNRMVDFDKMNKDARA